MFDIPRLGVIVARLKRPRHSHSRRPATTVIDLPELNDIIFSQLSRSDLVQWACVSKQWHHDIIPYLWYDLSALTGSQYRRLARMIVSDYQRVHSYPSKMTGGQRSSLVKYCPLIRRLGLVSGYDSICPSTFLLQFILMDLLDTIPADDAESKAEGIFHNFMIHCTHLEALEFDMPRSSFSKSVELIADSAIQHLRHLSIHGSISDGSFRYMLARCPTTLETLELCFSSSSYRYGRTSMQVDEAGPAPLSSLKRLTLRGCENNYLDILSSLWRRCESVEVLELLKCSSTFCQALPTTMLTFLPNLNTISIEEDRFVQRDQGVARLLSASQLGWRSVSIRGYVQFGERSWEALSQHASTLEKVELAMFSREDGARDPELRPFLTSFSGLQAFVTLAENEVDGSKINAIRAIDCIHEDPLSASLTPWLCEHTLTDLRIRVSGIPRPDVTHDHRGKVRQPTVEESYPGEGPTLQYRVYERLARFVNLEVLWLGSNSYDFEYTATYRPKKVPKHQYECLEISLQSGLDQLEGLKRLKVLNVSLMATRIGPKEAQWMAEQWPELREIHGLENRGGALRARQWFGRKSPRIAAPLLSTNE